MKKIISSKPEVNIKALNQAKHYIAVFEGIYKVQKNVKKAILELESKEIKGFTKRTLERAIKTYYNDESLTIKSYIDKYFSDKLTDKNKVINS